VNFEDFFALAYLALFILGALLSILPAYIAYKKNKNFWRWWFGTTSVFVIALFIMIQTQAISRIIYLLAILPVASMLAILPQPTIISNQTRIRDVLFFSSVLIMLSVIGAMLYFYLLYPRGSFLAEIEKTYFITLAATILIACLGLTTFIFIASERRWVEFVVGIFLILLLALPIFLKPSRAYILLRIPSYIIETDISMGPIITDLIRMPIAGIFVLIGFCSGCVAILIILNGKYRLASAGGTTALLILNTAARYLPTIRLSKSPDLSLYILAGVFLLRFLISRLFRIESDVIMGLVWALLMMRGAIMIGVLGIILSSIVILISIKQQKIFTGVGLIVIGLLAVSMDTSLAWAGPDLFRILILYGIASGFAALILWIGRIF